VECSVGDPLSGPDALLMFSAASVGMVVNKNRHPNPQPLVLVAVVPAVNLDLADWKKWVVPM